MADAHNNAGSGLGSTTGVDGSGLTPAPDASDGLELRDAPSASAAAAERERIAGEERAAIRRVVITTLPVIPHQYGALLFRRDVLKLLDSRDKETP